MMKLVIYVLFIALQLVSNIYCYTCSEYYHIER